MNTNIEHIRQMLASRHRTKGTIMEEAIKNRLNKSLLTYSEELDAGVEDIQSKSELNVIKKL